MNNRNKILVWLVIGGGVLLIMAGLAFTWANRASLTAATPPPASVEQVERVALAEAKAAFDAGKAVFLDVRDPGAYAATHIPGAVSIPLNDLTKRMDELDPDSWIIPYCTWLAEESSASAALLLIEQGFAKVTPILGGFAAWDEAGYPVESVK